MVATNQHAPIPIALDRLQADFAALLPRIERTVRFHLRHIPDLDHRADAVAEAVAVAWHWYRRCAERGKDAAQFVTSLASLAARFVRAGRGLCGQQPGTDALSPLAQRRHGFITVPLKTGSGMIGEIYEDALHENTRSPVPDQVQFRCDFPRWLRRLGGRDRRVARTLMAGERAVDVACQFGLTKGRVSQLRRAFKQDWDAYVGGAD
jgi:hypothetical protein